MRGIDIQKLGSKIVNVSACNARDCKWLTGVPCSRTNEAFERKMEKQAAAGPFRLESSKVEAGAPGAQVSSSIDGTASTRAMAAPANAAAAFPSLLTSPFARKSHSPPPMPLPIKPHAISSKKSKFPTDFFSTRAHNRSALYGETLNVLQEDDEMPHYWKEGTLLEKVEQLKEDALMWCCGWGGVAYWHISLHESYSAACELDRPDKWEEELLRHAANGRLLLFQLTSMAELIADGPCMSHRLKEMLHILIEVMQMITMGLTVLNMRCSILPNNVWAVQRLYRVSSREGSWSSEEDIVE